MSQHTTAKRATPYLSRTKVTPPAPSPFEIPRQLILDRLSAAEGSRVILVHAPAGFGKTTVMAQLRAIYQERGIATAWLTLDEGDNDVTRFLAAFAMAIGKLPIGEDDPGPMPERNADLVRWILDRFAAVDGPLAMFFDDVEAIRNPVVAGLIAGGIEAVAPDARIVIGCRTQPELGLARLRARGLLTEIDAAALRFSAEEAGDFLMQRRKVTLNTEQVARLHHSTEGWATALWLASLALERHSDADRFLASFSGSNAAIAAYLAEDVLAALPETLRSFMLDCSILDELEPALCDAVAGCTDSAGRLRELERHHLFLVPLDEERGICRFHGLFRDFLHNQLQRQRPQDVAALHTRASQAYLEAERPVRAIRHALQSGVVDTAVTLLNRHVDELLAQGRLRLLADWLGQLPPAQLDRHPRLKVIHPWCVTFTRGAAQALALVDDLDKATLPAASAADLLALRPMLLAMMDRIEEAHHLGAESLPQIAETHGFARAMLCQALTQTSIILGAHEDAIRYVDEARRAQKDARFAMVLAESAEALLDLMGGRLRQAGVRMRHATGATDRESLRERNGNVLATVQLAEVLYETDACAEAQRLLEVAAPLVQDLGLPDALISAHVLLARIVDEQGERDRALQLLMRLESIGHRLDLPRVVSSARLERAHLYLGHGDAAGCAGQLASAEQVYRWDDAASRWFVANDTLTPAIGRLRWMIRTGAAAKAIPMIRAELAEAEQRQRGRRALKLRILLAEALHADSQHKMALRTLARALQTAQGEGFVRTFIEEGPTIQALLHELSQDPGHAAAEGGAIEPGSIERWLRTPAGIPAAPVPSMALTEPLTPKELQVLALLAQGYSNIAMADRLFVSESTVRTHLRSINLKLHAANRTQAIAIARRLNLVS